VIHVDSKLEETVKKMIEAPDKQRLELARKRTKEIVELPKEQLVKQIEGTILAFEHLDDEDMKAAVKAIITTLEELPPEKKIKFISARAKAGLNVPRELNDKILKVGVDATREISEESFNLFKREYAKASEAYNLPIPEFLA
jgi:hypothetical protein